MFIESDGQIVYVAAFDDDDRAFEMLSFGYHKCPPEHTYGPDVRDAYVIHIVLEGEGTLIKNGKRMRLQKDKAFLTRAGEPFTYRADSDNPWHYVWIIFRGKKAEEAVVEMGFTEDRCVISVEDTSKIAEVILKALKLRGVTPADNHLRYAFMYQVFHYLCADKKNLVNLEPNGAEIAAAYIKENIRKKITVNGLASMIGFNRSQLFRLFRSTYNMSPNEYILNHRLEVSMSIIRNTNFPLARISEETGFANYENFSRRFKEKFGVKPSEIRKMKKETI